MTQWKKQDMPGTQIAHQGEKEEKMSIYPSQKRSWKESLPHITIRYHNLEPQMKGWKIVQSIMHPHKH